MNKKLPILLMLCLLTIFSHNSDASLISNSSCQARYFDLLKDRKMPGKEKVAVWKTCRTECSSKDEYDFYLANLYFLYSKKDVEKSKEIFKKIINVNKNILLVQESEKMLMAIDFHEDQFRTLRKKALRVVKQYPQWYCGYVFLGIAEMYLGNNYSKAKEYFEKSIVLEETAMGRCWQAYAEYQLKNHRRSLQLYERAMELDMVVLLAAPPTMAAAHSAMILEKWSAARWILNAQKSANRDIENCSGDYQELIKMLKQHDEEQKNISVK